MLSNLSQPSGANAASFKATSLWLTLVQYVYENVKQKRRRLLLKGVGPTECFTGSDVCDTVLYYLMSDRDNLKTSDINRDKAVKLCQLLLDQSIYEPLAGSSDRVFGDDSTKCYKFSSSVIQMATERKWGRDATTKIRSSSVASAEIGGVKARRPSLPSKSSAEVVVCNPVNSLGFASHTIQDLLGIADSALTDKCGSSSVLRDTNGKDRHSRTTSVVKKVYNECVLTRRTCSLNCESAFLTGIMTRQISAGTGTPGVYMRKGSASSLGRQSQCAVTGWGVRTPTLRRSLRLRGTLAQQTGSGAEFETGRNCCKLAHSDSHAESNKERAGSVHQVDDVSHSSKSVHKLSQLTGEVIFSPAAISEMKQEIALSQLSQLLDLPFLEGLVCSSNQGKESPGYDNSVFFDTHQHMTGKSGADVWVQTAIQVFDFMPNGHKTTFDYQVGLNQLDYKLALYKSIRKSYRARTEPLFPVCHEQIHLAVLGLILSKQEERAMFVMRLAAMLLPCYLVAELSTLLKFLHVVRESVEPKIRANQSNNDCVLNDFSGIFYMGYKLLSDQRRMLLLLLLHYSDSLASVPCSVQLTLERTLESVKSGDDTPTPSTLFCDNLTPQEYEAQQAATTEMAIISLVKNVIEDTTLPLKEKQKHIKGFHKHHPQIMNKYFSDIA